MTHNQHDRQHVDIAPQQVVCGRPSCRQGLSALGVIAAPGPEEKSHGQDQRSQRHHLHHRIAVNMYLLSGMDHPN